MMKATIEQAIQIAIQHHQAGRLSEAEAIYRQALAYKPDHADALHLLGVIAFQSGRADAAVELIRRAISLDPNQPTFHGNMGNVLRQMGLLEDALAEYDQALRLRPKYPEALNNRGIVLGDKGRGEESIASFRRAIELKPDYAEAHSNLGNALFGAGNYDEAIAECREAIRLNPNLAETYNNLASVLRERGFVEESIVACREAIRLKPDLSGAYSNLGNAFFEKGQLQEAIEAQNEALRLEPDLPAAHTNLGNALREYGQLEQAIQSYRRAIELAPKDSSFHSNLVYALHFDDRISGDELLAEHQRWAEKFAKPLKALIREHENDRSPDRRLRVGYVSRDLRAHPVGRFLLPLLANHDHEQFEIFCYSSVQAPDGFTARLQHCADVWRDVRSVSDEAAAELIRQDKIDILIDLTLHGANNRLQLFARKPAPIQASYLAYPGTTGLAAMDYRITDRYLDPPELGDGRYTERSVYLPDTYWCYEPATGSMGVGALRAAEAGFVTFGCLNNFCKITNAALRTWREIILAVPRSRLILHAAVGNHRERIVQEFSANGIDSSRLTFVERQGPAKYFEEYHKIDIALDPFPYGGGTTTCDALWMGAPVVTLRGKTAVGRAGVSILSNLSLMDWIAEDVGQYVSIAKEKANDLAGLAAMRAGLRQRMRESPLMDGKRFAAGFETLYRLMWKQWCEGRRGEPSDD